MDDIVRERLTMERNASQWAEAWKRALHRATQRRLRNLGVALP